VNLSRSEEVHSSNDHIAERAVSLRFVSRVPMLCECSDPRCQSIILIGLERYGDLRETGFFTAPDHTIDGAEPGLREDGWWLHEPPRGSARSQARS
jgi:hypothetical protein